MSSRLLYSILLAGIFTLSAGAETPVATISSSAPFEVRGVRIPVAGVPSWPLVQGDVVATTTAPAVVSFPDLSQATVEKGSRIELKRSGNHTALKLLGGSLSFRAATGSTVQLQTLDRAITPVAG